MLDEAHLDRFRWIPSDLKHFVSHFCCFQATLTQFQSSQFHRGSVNSSECSDAHEGRAKRQNLLKTRKLEGKDTPKRSCGILMA